MSFRSLLALAVLAALDLAPASAQDGAKGIAFSQAPEQSLGVCTGPDAAKTIDCAVQKCVEGGAAAEDCAPMAWCFPMGWSADVFIQHKEGIHWHEFLCGLDSKESAVATAKVKCDPALRPYILECSVTRFWDPEGNEMDAN